MNRRGWQVARDMKTLNVSKSVEKNMLSFLADIETCTSITTSIADLKNVLCNNF